MAEKTMPVNSEVRISTLKIGEVTVNVTSTFLSEKNLYEIMYSIVNLAMKEKSA